MVINIRWIVFGSWWEAREAQGSDTHVILGTRNHSNITTHLARERLGFLSRIAQSFLNRSDDLIRFWSDHLRDLSSQLWGEIFTSWVISAAKEVDEIDNEFAEMSALKKLVWKSFHSSPMMAFRHSGLSRFSIRTFVIADPSCLPLWEQYGSGC